MKSVIIIAIPLIITNTYSNNSDSNVFLKINTAESADTTLKGTLVSDSAVKALSVTSLYCTVTTNSFKVYKNVKLSELSDSSVKIFIGSKSKEIPVRDIRSVKLNNSGFWKGARYGAGGALAIGLIIGLTDTTGEYLWDGIKIGLLLAIPLGIGTGIFYEIKNDKEFDLSKLDFQAKRKKIKYIIRTFQSG